MKKILRQIENWHITHKLYRWELYFLINLAVSQTFPHVKKMLMTLLQTYRIENFIKNVSSWWDTRVLCKRKSSFSSFTGGAKCQNLKLTRVYIDIIQQISHIMWQIRWIITKYRPNALLNMFFINENVRF